MLTNTSTVPSADTSATDEVVEKRKKRKKQRPLISSVSTSSDRLCSVTKSKKMKTKTRNKTSKEKTLQTDSPSPPTDNTDLGANSFSLLSPHSYKTDPLSSESSALLSLSDGKKTLYSQHSSSLNDLNNVGTDDKIVIEQVTGLAYGFSTPVQDTSKPQSPANLSLIDTTCLSR